MPIIVGLLGSKKHDNLQIEEVSDERSQITSELDITSSKNDATNVDKSVSMLNVK